MRRPLIITLLLLGLASGARAESALGPRAGFVDGEFYAGGQMEFMRRFGSLSLVPSVDFAVGSDAQSVANADLRLYLFPLPETGLRFYAGAGPTMLLSGDLELGLSLTVGLNLPMRGSRRYNIEYRKGLGDIPDHKLAVAVLFGL